ncbi:notchless protein [Trifolium repens]|nr:notchless protein [Trifolium repens]
MSLHQSVDSHHTTGDPLSRLYGDLWNGTTGKFVATFRHVLDVYQISWSADSRLLLSGSKESTLKVWDIRTRKLKEDLPGHVSEVYCVDWSPDGEKVASGGKDKVMKLWMG